MWSDYTYRINRRVLLKAEMADISYQLMQHDKFIGNSGHE